MLLSQDKLDHRDSVSKHGKSLWKTKQKTTHNQAQTKRPRLLQQSKTERSHHCCNSAKAVKTPGFTPHVCRGAPAWQTFLLPSGLGRGWSASAHTPRTLWGRITQGSSAFSESAQKARAGILVNLLLTNTPTSCWV